MFKSEIMFSVLQSCNAQRTSTEDMLEPYADERYRLHSER